MLRRFLLPDHQGSVKAAPKKNEKLEKSA